MFKFFNNLNNMVLVTGIGVQDPATPSMEGMLFFHHQLMFLLVMIGILKINL